MQQKGGEEQQLHRIHFWKGLRVIICSKTPALWSTLPTSSVVTCYLVSLSLTYQIRLALDQYTLSFTLEVTVEL